MSVSDSRTDVENWITQVQSRLRRFRLQGPERALSLQFTDPPGSQDSESLQASNLALQPDSEKNSFVLYHETWLRDQARTATEQLRKYPNDANLVQCLEALLKDLGNGLNDSEQLKRTEWERQRALSCEDNQVDPGPYMQSPFLGMEAWAIGIYFVVLCLHLMSGVSQDQCSFYLTILTKILCPTQSQTPSSFPATVETLISRVNIAPKTKSYTCCPKCFCLYDPTSSPPTCTATEIHGGEPCGAELLKDSKPIHQYVVQDFREWLARLYARPDIEDLLDRDVLGSEGEDEMRDIWDGTALKELRGADGRPFMQRQGTEGRLVFSLNMDGFNPHGNRQSGKHVSVGAIYMTCLNLPREIRNKMENVFLVGIIPGPNEPSLTQINHLVSPLVDILLDLWHKGLFLHRTPRHKLGRRIYVAMVPLICDLPAAKKMAGFGSARSNLFCSHCYLNLDNIDDLDYSSWKRRTQGVHRERAEEWRDTEDPSIRDDIFAKHGLRWSELLRLPYWDPTSYVVIDSMHCFYLGLFHRHAIHIWGMDAGMDDGDGVTFNKLSQRPTNDELKSALLLFYGNNFKSLQKLPWHTLAHLCVLFKLRFGGTKQALLSNLREDPALDTSKLNKSALIQEIQQRRRLANIIDEENKVKDPEMQKAWKQRNKDTRAFQSAGSSTREPSAVDDPDHEFARIARLPRSKPPKHEKAWNPDIPQIEKFRKTCVLGRETISEIQKDISHLSLPSWVPKGPAHPGQAKGGKLHADQWRSFFTINLPVTLTRLWGSEDSTSRKALMLENLFELVSAVKIASLRCITDQEINLYEKHFAKYLATLLNLFPGTKIAPYQHIAMHFGEFLRRFGPTHGWRCFAFERYNYLLQQSSTNQILGKMEKTMLDRFCMLQNLRAYFNSRDVPENLHFLIQSYSHLVNRDMRGTFLSEDVNHDDQNSGGADSILAKTFILPSATFDLLKVHLEVANSMGITTVGTISRSANLRTSVFKDVLYQATGTSGPNSQVMFRLQDQDKYHWSAGSLLLIFNHERETQEAGRVEETFMLIAPYKPVTLPRTRIPAVFEQFPFISGKLFYKSTLPCLLLSLKEIIGHYAYANIKWRSTSPVDAAEAKLVGLAEFLDKNSGYSGNKGPEWVDPREPRVGAALWVLLQASNSPLVIGALRDFLKEGPVMPPADGEMDIDPPESTPITPGNKGKRVRHRTPPAPSTNVPGPSRHQEAIDCIPGSETKVPSTQNGVTKVSLYRLVERLMSPQKETGCGGQSRTPTSASS
ncbi:hypothetical protein NP233_g8865 [Leucocoprinus birnbaumii]|uniref:Uncharacterized protein n=1 Tax=Leucocoprinus birnbaumii TaxID=56174 RepID=A0AAD5VNY0_9AGAR|nr:hypothetical protein NP233_g8865 [Leucocoprinus birnbaumii]